jgi:spore maturation protein CgeB
MKILIIGREVDPSLEKLYLYHFKELVGSDNVIIFPAQDLFLKYYNSSIIRKILFRIGFKKIYFEINKNLIYHVKSFKPDIIWVFKGMEIFPETLLKLKLEFKISLFNFNPDNPFIFSGKGSGNKNIINSLNLYNHHFTYDHLVKSKFESNGFSTSLLPFGFSLSDLVLLKSINQKEKLKVCFVGNPDKIRIKFLHELANSNIMIDVYGDNWEKCIKHKNITSFNCVFNDDFWIILRQYRVQLNMMRLHNLETHNMRSFEIPGIGGIQLAPDTMDHRLYFEVDKEIILYKDINDCVHKINFLLELDFEVANKIRIAARKKSIEANYSYKDRTTHVLMKFNEILYEN